jgi:ribonuclease P protein subunit POP4
MPITPETLTRHELNGLRVEVVDASNPDSVGIAGRVVVETRGTLHVDDGSRVRQVQKQGATFQFALPGDDTKSATAGPVAARKYTDERASDGPARTDDRSGMHPERTDEAAGRREATGGVSKRESETSAVRRRQSGSPGGSTGDGNETPSAADCEGATYVTVDGARLLSRPARRTETTGDSKWR